MGLEGQKFLSRRQQAKNALKSALAAAAFISAVPESTKAQSITPYDVGGFEHTGTKKPTPAASIGEAWSVEAAAQEAPQPVLVQDEKRITQYLLMRENLKGFHVQFSAEEARWPQYEEFCQDLEIFCEKFARSIDEPQEREMSPETLARIVDINREVAEEVLPAEDIKVYGMSDKWTIPGVEGDCEDFVLLKMIRLIDAGIDPSRLHILVVRDRGTREGHAILGIDVLVGGKLNTLVLDNLISEVATVEQMERVYEGVYTSFVSRDEKGKLDVRFFKYKKAAQ